ncbi:hypothetical protein VNO77_18815 [Canavalia gladiata]|uniref:Uncharacterized protein n=1 Tax=Canavalia gladiata TaxID=3824 RepID=A0AAN9LRG2_CANGL
MDGGSRRWVLLSMCVRSDNDSGEENEGPRELRENWSEREGEGFFSSWRSGCMRQFVITGHRDGQRRGAARVELGRLGKNSIAAMAY